MATALSLPSILVTTLLLVLFLLSSFTPLVSSARCNPADKKVLLKIKSELGDPYILIAWNTEGAGGCCDWFGVECDATTNRVVGIDIFAGDINATIPPSIAGFPNLRTLSFHKNNLTGPIPPAVGTLTKLTFLRLDWNALTGPIPDFVFSLPSLDYLNLAFNQFSGSIPASIAKPPLGFINLSRNKFTGAIPSELAMSISTYLYLSHNQLTGPFPASFAKTKFETIDVSRNSLTGDATILFGASKPLVSLDLSRNLFEFDLTNVKFPKNMTLLDLNHNKVYGGIPKEITKLELQSFNVSYNRLCGEIPSGGGLARFDEYSFFHNRCLCGPPLAPCKTEEGLLDGLQDGLGRKLK